MYVNVDKPLVIINSEITNKSKAIYEPRDDCMSFPNLLVKAKLHQSLTLTHKDKHWQTRVLNLNEDMSELLYMNMTI